MLTVLTTVECELLVECLPAFSSIRKIQLCLDNESRHLKSRLLSAFSKNGSLTEIHIEAPFLNEADHSFLRSITVRNKKLPPLIRSTPEKSGLPLGLWPTMFEASAKSTKGAGANDAFCLLLGLEDLAGGCGEESDIDGESDGECQPWCCRSKQKQQQWLYSCVQTRQIRTMFENSDISCYPP